MSGASAAMRGTDSSSPRLAQSRALVAARRFAVALFEGKLFAVGGGSSVFLSSVESLSSPGGSWVLEANGLNVARERCVGAPRPRVMSDGCLL